MKILPDTSLSVKARKPESSRRPSARPSTRKALGQHYLTDKGTIQQILSTSQLNPHDTVLEVGPGLGAVTFPLVQSAQSVVAIEIDPRLAASLPGRLGNPPNLRVINADARDVELTNVLEENANYKLVANLPYYAASPILRRFLETVTHRPALIVVMVQREVARSMAAEDGRMSLLAVGIQVYGIPSIICDVPPEAFYPPPKVTSTVVKIVPRHRMAIEVENTEGFFNVVRAGFFAPRKQIRNSLGLGLSMSTEQVGHLLESAKLDPKLRPENLSLEEWGRLYQASLHQ
ncbi:MAG: ribosomal RNA small subunit methyltransferase A [Dehalococcoidia bacterium]|nr:ribosomal RNA small subunit methyltransferase A [Dehalococcoidia bacterium]